MEVEEGASATSSELVSSININSSIEFVKDKDLQIFNEFLGVWTSNSKCQKTGVPVAWWLTMQISWFNPAVEQ